MKFRIIQRRKSSDVLLELTPLIDVIFLLLIFFMVSTTFVDVNTGINIKLPESTVQEVVKSSEIIISLSANKVIFIQNNKVTLDEFERELKKTLEEEKKTNVIIKGDEGLDYGFVVKIMTMCKNAGATELDIATEEEK